MTADLTRAEIEHIAIFGAGQGRPSQKVKQAITQLLRQLDAANAWAYTQEQYKDGAYLERNKLVLLLASIYPSGIKKTAIKGWSEDWHSCVYIDFPWGQASWHYHDSQAALFAHLLPYNGEWDGHTTDEKYGAIMSAALPLHDEPQT